MHFLSILLLCIAPNLDNMAIGLAYGARKINVPFKSNCSVAIFSGLATLLSSIFGGFLTKYIPTYLGGIIGGSIVSIIGVYTIVSYFCNKIKSNKLNDTNYLYIDDIKAVIEDPSLADKDYSGDISLKESLLLGFALAVNCIGTGFGAGMMGINSIILSVAVIMLSLATISVGELLGKRYASKFSGGKATVVSGLLLIAVGVFQMLI